MNQLFFTTQNRRSLKTLRLHYGLEGMKYIIQIYEGEVNGHGVKEGLPTEYQYEFEQEMLKHVQDLKRMWEKKDGRIEKLQRFSRRHFWGVKTQMENWGLGLYERIHVWEFLWDRWTETKSHI